MLSHSRRILLQTLVFGVALGIVEGHAVFVSTGVFDLRTAVGVFVYDVLALGLVGLALALVASFGAASRAVAWLAPSLLLGGLWLARMALDALKAGGMGKIEAVVVSFVAGAAVAALLPALLRRSPLTIGQAAVFGIPALLYTGLIWKLTLGLASPWHVLGATATALTMVSALTLVSARAPAAVISMLALGFLSAPLARAIAGPIDVTLVHDELGELANEAPPGSPNVILIVLDTLRADHLETYGYERKTMPAVARLAERSTVYDDATSGSSWTLPGHAMLLTGLYSRTHGAHGGSADSAAPAVAGAQPLAPEHETLAEGLRAHGYATAGILSNWLFLRPKFGLDQGFDYWDARGSHRGVLHHGYFPLLLLSLSVIDILPIRVLVEPLVRFDVAQVAYRRAETITDEAIALIEGRLSLASRPFLLMLNYMDPHAPYIAPEEFQDHFPGRIQGAPRRKQAQRLRQGDDVQIAHLLATYDNEIAYLDKHLGRLIDFLEQSGRLEDTVVVVTADHGEAFYEHGTRDHGHTLFQEEIRVPLIVYDPASTEGRRIAAPVDLRIVLPFVFERVGATVPEAVRLQRGGPPVSELYGVANDDDGSMQDLVALREGPLKLISAAEGDSRAYDLSVEPSEQTPLLPESASIDNLHGSLRSWQSAVRAADGKESVIDADELERLKALGYVQ